MPPPVESQKKLDTGIYQTPSGFRVYMRIGGVLESKRFPATHSLDALRRWREDHIRLRRPKAGLAKRGTFGADTVTYLHAVSAMPSYLDRVREIESWLPVFETRPRWSIHANEIRAVLQRWRLTLAASTCNHRRTALSHLYTVLDGKAQYNPVRDVPPFPEPPPQQRGISQVEILRTIRRVRGKMTKARLLVLTWTGMRPSELGRVTAADVDLERGLCYVRTAKGGPPRMIALNRSAVRAFRSVARAEAWGTFSTASVRKSLVLACRHAGRAPFRVYDLRHSYLTAMRMGGADLADVQHTAGHSSIRLTTRYAPAVMDKLKVAAEAARRVKW